MRHQEFVRKAMLARLSFGQEVLVISAAVALPTALRWILGPSAQAVPFVTYFPFILLITALRGWRWGTVAAIASAFFANRLFLPHPLIDPSSRGELGVLFYFICSCAALIVAGNALRLTVMRMEELLRERELLQQEMFHRVQNTLMVVEAMAQLADKSRPSEEVLADFSARVGALARANKVLQGGPEKGEVRQLVELAIKPFHQPNAFQIEGPSVSLPVKVRHHLILVLHELCTNALKHGALSVSNGRIEITWSHDGEAFKLEWTESGGPPVETPKRQGLGSRLLSTLPTFDVQSRYNIEGVICIVTTRSE